MPNGFAIKERDTIFTPFIVKPKQKNMTKLLTTVALFWVSITLLSCNGGTKQQLLSHYKKVYKAALRNGDLNTAENAVYQQWVLDTANGFSYKDTLLYLYYNGRQYGQAVNVGRELLAKKPDDLTILQITGDAALNVNDLTDALNCDKLVYQKTQDLLTLYKIANIDFSLNKFDECNSAIDHIVADPSSLDKNISVGDGKGGQQQVPFRAAALNMKGVIAKSLKQYDEAKKDFDDALAAFPNFELAKFNIDNLKK